MQKYLETKENSKQFLNLADLKLSFDSKAGRVAFFLFSPSAVCSALLFSFGMTVSAPIAWLFFLLPALYVGIYLEVFRRQILVFKNRNLKGPIRNSSYVSKGIALNLFILGTALSLWAYFFEASEKSPKRGTLF